MLKCVHITFTVQSCMYCNHIWCFKIFLPTYCQIPRCFLTMYSIHSLRYYYCTPIHLPLLWLQWSVFTKNFSLILKREKISTCHVFTLFNNQSQRIHLKYRMGRWPDEGGWRGIVQCKYTTSCLGASQQQPLSLVSIWIPPPPCRWRKCVQWDAPQTALVPHNNCLCH